MSWLFGTKKKVVEVGVEPKTKSEEESGFVVVEPPSYQSPLHYPGRQLYPTLPYPLAAPAPASFNPTHLGAEVHKSPLESVPFKLNPYLTGERGRRGTASADVSRLRGQLSRLHSQLPSYQYDFTPERNVILEAHSS